jgi:hypothetical protein
MIVPLGLECSVAHYLRANHLREAALPFDWNITPFTSVMRLLDSGFADFLREDHLVYLPPVQRLLFTEDGLSLVTADEVITPVVCRNYGMLLPHDFSAQGQLDYPRVKQAYDARCGRLRNLLIADRPVTFVYHVAPLNEWQVRQYESAGVPLPVPQAIDCAGLSAIIRRINPRLPFRILSLDELKST